MYDAPYVHDEAEKAEYLRLGQGVCQLLEKGNNSEAMRSFFKGIGIPKIFVFFIRLTSDWPAMVALVSARALLPVLSRFFKPNIAFNQA